MARPSELSSLWARVSSCCVSGKTAEPGTQPSEGHVAKCQSSAGGPSNFLLPPSPVVDPNRSRLSICTGSIATPRPILRTRHQSAHHRVAMHVLQLLHLFLLAPQIEIIETALPEPAGQFAADGQPAGDAQLHGLNYL